MIINTHPEIRSRRSITDRSLPGMSVGRRDFSECKAAMRGPVFIIASGASAAGFPIHEFSCVPMITMNGAISMFLGTGIDPFFYVCSDRDFSRQQPELFNAALRSSRNVALWDDQVETLQTPPIGNVYPLKKAQRAGTVKLFEPQPALVRKLSLFSKRNKDIGFSKDMGLGFFDARTVMYVAMQLACHLGFNKVFLVGFDLNQNTRRFYETHHSSPSPCGLDQHYESRILPSLKLMSNAVMNDDFQVYNLSASSRVPESLIPRMSLDDVRLSLGLAGFHG